jgi:hypothetical protein
MFLLGKGFDSYQASRIKALASVFLLGWTSAGASFQGSQVDGSRLLFSARNDPVQY